jgi:nucleotide-binding universal stress UspA family protein
MKNILVASDLSARSDRALARAVMLGRQHGSRLTVLHVVDEDLPAAIADRQVEDAQRVLRTTLASVPDAGAVSSDVRVVVGEHYQSIIAQTEELDVDLVVVGQHRKDVLLNLFRGSTGERVVRFGTRPVLIVKSAATHNYLSILAAIDFSVPCSRAIETAAKLAPDADIKLVHAFDIPFRGLLFGGSSMDQLAKKHQRQFQETVEAQTRTFLDTLSVPVALRQVIAREGMPEEVILQVAGETRCDLLALGTHGRSGLGRALLGSVAESLIARAPCDVLAVRAW